MVFGFLPHTDCAVNKKKFEVRPKLKVGGGCIGAHMCAHNVFFEKIEVLVILWMFSNSKKNKFF